jgi:hypothetical protein
VTKTAEEPTKAFHLCMIVPSRPLPGTRAFEEQLRQFGYEEGRNPHLGCSRWRRPRNRGAILRLSYATKKLKDFRAIFPSQKC